MSSTQLVLSNDVIIVNGTVTANTLDASTLGTNNLTVTGDIYVGTNETYVPVGCISIYSGATAPSGWLICNGQEISRSTYSNLYEIIGTTYGSGNNVDTFNLPNLQERLPLGKSQSANLGATGGSNEVTLHP